MNAKRAMEILLIEDNANDVRLISETFRKGNLPYNLHVMADGVEALAFLRKQKPHAAAPRPDLIVLDLKLPKKDGREVLAEIKSAPELKRIPVVVLTVSEAEEEVFRAYGLHANCFITKPVNVEKFIEVVNRIEHFWFSIAMLPTRTSAL